jgi:hypothetical protein
MKKFSDKRIIKQISNIPLNTGESGLHPLTLEFGRNETKNTMIVTQFYLNEKKELQLNIPESTKNIVKSRNDRDNMQFPDLSLPLTDYLNIYDIDSYDELIASLKKMVDKDIPESTIFRLVNIYVRIEFNELKKINNSLVKIFKIIFKNKKVNNEAFVNKFLKNWFDKNNKDSFKLNICEDFKNDLDNN